LSDFKKEGICRLKEGIKVRQFMEYARYTTSTLEDTLRKIDFRQLIDGSKYTAYNTGGWIYLNFTKDGKPTLLAFQNIPFTNYFEILGDEKTLC